MDEPKTTKDPTTVTHPKPEPVPAPPARDDTAPGSLWTVEEEGFALVGQHGDGTRVRAPAGHQPPLFDVGKPDTAVLERLRAEELAERRAKRPPPDTSDPLLQRGGPLLTPEERLESAANGLSPSYGDRTSPLSVGARVNGTWGDGIGTVLQEVPGFFGKTGYWVRWEGLPSGDDAKLVTRDSIWPAGAAARPAPPETPSAPPTPPKGPTPERRSRPRGSQRSARGPASTQPTKTRSELEAEANRRSPWGPLPPGFPLYDENDEIREVSPQYRAYMEHHGETDPERMMGRDTARYPIAHHGYRDWLAAHPTEPEDAPAEPTARLEYVDVATGAPADPNEPGTLSTGRIVADIDGETVEIDREDLIGHGTDPDPRKRRYPYDAESPADYTGRARTRKAARASTPAKAKEARRKARHAGLRETFDSPAKAAAIFYDHNEDFFDHVIDPWDGLRDWMDGVEARVGRGHRKLSKTPAGRRILEEKHAARAIRKALAYLMGQAKGRRWEAVPWVQVERLGEALARYFEAPSSGPGQPGIYWRPFTGEIRVEDLDTMTPEQRASIREQESAREIGEQLDALREAYGRAKDCLPDDLRRAIERRIAEWSRWVEDPSRIPDYACEPDPKSAGYLCNYPAVAGELAQLRRSCEDAYDPNWAAKESKQGAPGFPDTSQGEDEAPPPRTASAKACCSTATPKTEAAKEPACKLAAAGKVAKPAASKPGKRKAPSSPPPTAKPKERTSKRPAPVKATKQGPARKPTVAERRKGLADRKKDLERRRKLTAAQRRAQRLSCSAAVARKQVEAIDTLSYRRRVADAAAAVEKAEEHVKHHERDLKATMRDAEAVMRARGSMPMDREIARRKVREAQCQLRVAQGALRQRKRDHQRAQTELQRALTRASKRQAIASKRDDEAKKAQAEALELSPDRR